MVNLRVQNKNNDNEDVGHVVLVSDPVWRVCQSCAGVSTHLESQVKWGFGLSGYHLLSSSKIVTLFEGVCVEGAW